MELSTAEKGMIQKIATSKFGITSGYPERPEETLTLLWDVNKNEQDETIINTLRDKSLIRLVTGRLIQLTDAGFTAYSRSLVQEEVTPNEGSI
jgi:hypothetical protein